LCKCNNLIIIRISVRLVVYLLVFKQVGLGNRSVTNPPALQITDYHKRKHRGRHAKIFGWAKSPAYMTDVLQRSMAYNSQHWDWGQTDILCDVCKIRWRV